MNGKEHKRLFAFRILPSEAEDLQELAAARGVSADGKWQRGQVMEHWKDVA